MVRAKNEPIKPDLTRLINCLTHPVRLRKTTDAGTFWFTQHKSKPFFLFVHYFDPHYRYQPPPPFDTMYKTDNNLDEYIARRKIPETAVLELPQKNKKIIFHAKARDVSNSYDGEIRYMDEQIGRLLTGLQSQPSWNDTAVLIMGDHGEGLCQHGKVGHGETWDEHLHVPMMIRVHGEPHRRIPYVVSAVDAIPTLLAIVNVPALNAFMSQASGHNVLEKGFEATPVFSQDSGRKSDAEGYRYTLTSDSWKFIWTKNQTDKDQLYNLHDDPYELNNDIVQNADIARSMKKAIQDHINAQVEKSAFLHSGTEQSTEVIDPLYIEQLESLGYLQ